MFWTLTIFAFAYHTGATSPQMSGLSSEEVCNQRGMEISSRLETNLDSSRLEPNSVTFVCTPDGRFKP